jgi:hypothetical protein
MSKKIKTVSSICEGVTVELEKIKDYQDQQADEYQAARQAAQAKELVALAESSKASKAIVNIRELFGET